MDEQSRKTGLPSDAVRMSAVPGEEGGGGLRRRGLLRAAAVAGVGTAGVLASPSPAQAFKAQYDPNGQSVFEIFDVTDFGATGDGVADDGPAIQAAVDAAPSCVDPARTDCGGIVFLPAGAYRIGSTITLKTGMTLVGAGIATTIIRPDSGVVIALNVPEANPQNEAVKLADFRLEGELVGGVPVVGTIGIQLSHTSYSVIQNVRVVRFDTGMLLRHSFVDTLYSVRVQTCNTGIKLLSVSHSTQVIGSTVGNCFDTGMLIRACFSPQIIGCDIEHNAKNGLVIAGRDVGQGDEAATRFPLIIANYFEVNDEVHIAIGGTAAGNFGADAVEGAYISGNHLASGAGYADLLVGNAKKVKAVNNIVTGAPSAGRIYLRAGSVDTFLQSNDLSTDPSSDVVADPTATLSPEVPQCGTASIPTDASGNGAVTVTFPIAFAFPPVAWAVSGTMPDQSGSWAVNQVTATSFRIQVWGDVVSSNASYSWCAFGRR